MSSTHNAYISDGYYITVQHCEHPRCDIYLGAAYPSLYCHDHQPSRADQ